MRAQKEGCQSQIKMDLKELYILSFYFHAFDFISRTKKRVLQN